MLYRPIAVEPPPGKPPAPSELSRLPIPTTTSLALEFEPVPLLASLTLYLPKMTLPPLPALFRHATLLVPTMMVPLAVPSQALLFTPMNTALGPLDRKRPRLNSSHQCAMRMPYCA